MVLHPADPPTDLGRMVDRAGHESHIPFADWLFGTSDLDRGLLGHLFNGYSTKYVKHDLSKARAGADWPLSHAVSASGK